MLDDSGSMNGQPWKDLMKAFTEFVQLLESNDSLKNNSKISVINHNETSFICIEEEEPR